MDDYGNYEQTMETQEEKDYENDLKNVFADITGYFYEFDKTKKKLKLKKGKNPKYCENMATQIIGLLMKAMTRYTRYTKNETNIVGLKTMENIKSLWLMYYGSFTHECGIGVVIPGSKIVTKSVTENENKKGKKTTKTITKTTKEKTIKIPGWCTRRYSESQINVMLIDPAWRLVDDSYRHSIGGFTRKERNKTYSVSETRNVSVKKDRNKKSWFDPRPENNEEEEEE